nr:hypothetical protein [Tanacetum cinerariifolium]
MDFRLVDGNSFDYTPDSYHPPHPIYETYSGDTCGNDSHFGYDCPPRFPLNYEPEPRYIQNYNSYPHDSPSFPQQYPCCEDCGQYIVNHPIFSAHHDLLGSQKKLNITLTKLPVCYDDDDDEESSKSLEDNIISELPSYSAFTPSDPVDSLSMGNEHLNTISATKSDEFIKSCVENLIPNPSESEGESDCDVHAGFTTFSNVLFDADYDFDSDQHSFNAESDLIESMPNHDSSVIISSKIDSLFDEFAGELTLLKSIPPGIDETDCHPEKETCCAKRLLYDNSSPRPPEEIVFDNSNADIESFSPSPIPNKDSDSHMEEIDLPFTPNDPMPPGIEDDNYDSGRDIPILEELLDNYSLSLPANESYHFDIPSPYCPPTKPPDGKTGTLNIKMMGDQKVPIPGLTITHISNQEKSPDLLSHQGLEAFQPSAECPIIINGKNIPLLDHLDTIPEKESDEFIKSSVEDLVPNPSEFEDECECDVPDCDDSQTTKFSTFSNPFFNDSTSSDNESSHEEVIHEMSFKMYSNLLFDLDEEIISSEFNPIHNEDLDSTLKNDRFDTESYLLESLLNRDTLMASSLKIDSLLAEFAAELIFLISIPPGIDEANCDPEEDIHLIKRLLYDNSSPRPPKEFVFENSDAEIESFSPSHIPNEDSDSLMKEIDLSFTLDDP